MGKPIQVVKVIEPVKCAGKIAYLHGHEIVCKCGEHHVYWKVEDLDESELINEGTDFEGVPWQNDVILSKRR